jgi:hypothetical protein
MTLLHFDMVDNLSWVVENLMEGKNIFKAASLQMSQNISRNLIFWKMY